MTDTDTRAALDAAIDEWIRLRGLSYLTGGAQAAQTARGQVDRAITAHVEAEVTRRLAAAAGVEEAIEAMWRDCDHSARCGKEIADDDHSQGRRGSPGDQDDCDCAVAGHLATLRAAIAADRERAVEAGSLTALDEFRKLLPKYEPRRITATTGVVPVVADAEGRMLGGRREGRDTIYDQVKVPVAVDSTHSMPYEVRRLVGEAIDAMRGIHAPYRQPAVAALLRALGVEA